MIRHLMKGLLRDRHRSLFPVMIVAAGVSISILMFCFMDGMIDDMVRSSARRHGAPEGRHEGIQRVDIAAAQRPGCKGL